MITKMKIARKLERYPLLEVSFHSKFLVWMMGALRDESKSLRKRQVV